MKYLILFHLLFMSQFVSSQTMQCLTHNKVIFTAHNRVGVNLTADLELIIKINQIEYEHNLKKILWSKSDLLFPTLIKKSTNIRITIGNGTSLDEFTKLLCKLSEIGMTQKNIYLQTKYLN